MAAVAVRLRLFGIVEAGDAVAGDAAQQKGIVVVLAAQPSVLVKRFRQVNLVASAAELRALVQGLQERALVQRWLRFDQERIDPTQDGVVRKREGIVRRRSDHVVGIAAHADGFDGVTGHAADAGVGGGIVDVVEVRIVEQAAEKRHRVVAAGAEPCRFHVAVACQYHAPGAAHRERIGGIVEGGEAVGAVLPVGVGVGVTARAIVVPHQVLRLDESAARGGRQRGQEIDRLGHRLLVRLGKPHPD